MELKRTWGKSTLYYCPINKKVWQKIHTGDIISYKGMPSYGLERKELPR